MKSYELSERADLDLLEISRYIMRDNEEAARRFLRKIHDKFQMLAENPRLGIRRDELLPGSRCIPFGSYLLFYQEASFGIQVIRVVHGSRDLDALLPPPEE